MRVALRWLSWIGIYLAASVTAWAQVEKAESYPSRTVTVVVPCLLYTSDAADE